MLKIRSNFSALHGNITTCSLCEDPRSEETEIHRHNCSYLKKDKTLEKDMAEVKLSDVYGSISEQKKIVKVFSKMMTIYEKNQKKNGTRSSSTSWASYSNHLFIIWYAYKYIYIYNILYNIIKHIVQHHTTYSYNIIQHNNILYNIN